MTEVKNLKVQEEFNSYIWETLYDYSKEKNPDVEMELHQVKTVPQCVCISLKGYVDSYNSNYFYQQCQKLLKSCLIRVIFDMKDLTYISSEGVAKTVLFLKELKRVGGDIVIVNFQEKVKHVFELLGLIGFFPYEDSVKDAISLYECSLK